MRDCQFESLNPRNNGRLGKVGAPIDALPSIAVLPERPPLYFTIEDLATGGSDGRRA